MTNFHQDDGHIMHCHARMRRPFRAGQFLHSIQVRQAVSRSGINMASRFAATDIGMLGMLAVQEVQLAHSLYFR